MCKKQAMGEKSFYKEMQNDPRSIDDYIFQDIKYWSNLPEYENMEVVMYIDSAIKSGKRNDYCAITILGRHRKTKQMYIIDGTLHKVISDDLFKISIEKLNIFSVEKIGFEVIHAQSYMKQKFEEELWKAKIYVHIEAINSRGQKHERIITFDPDIKNGHILFNSDNIQYNNQVKDYNKNCKHDDVLDSLYG